MTELHIKSNEGRCKRTRLVNHRSEKETSNLKKVHYFNLKIKLPFKTTFCCKQMFTNHQFCEYKTLVTFIDFELDSEICMKFPVTIHLKRNDGKTQSAFGLFV